MRARITINDEQQLEVLEAVRADLEASPIVQALGHGVSETAALRYLLGLACRHYPDLILLERGVKVTLVADDEPGQALQERVEPPKAEPQKAEPTIDLEDDEDEDEDDPELAPVHLRDDLPNLYETPPTWIMYDDGEWDFPEDQVGMHAYYARHGWTRGMAQLEDRVLNFYWTPKRRMQGLKPWSGQDDHGRRMIVQEAPPVFGVAHIVPDDFGAEPGSGGVGGMVVFGGA